ncbi:Hypp2551 [Branchiostoma lanceolatum]|uniref:Hypp2551 protein n=1 Tax=Branchiostoma lanceolatum TaxID=7740 RepID=A0A8K0EQK1_BRALA|nr:Hypp2551 [Branchiostoma lanceolatum]
MWLVPADAVFRVLINAPILPSRAVGSGWSRGSVISWRGHPVAQDRVAPSLFRRTPRLSLPYPGPEPVRAGLANPYFAW